MFDVGFWELVVVGVVGLIVIGPERLPGLMRVTGLWIEKARRSFAKTKKEIEDELHAEDLRRTLAKNSTVVEIRSLIDKTRGTLNETVNINAPRESHNPAQVELNKKPAKPD